MKYAFFTIVLVNLLFYLWVGQGGKSQHPNDPAGPESSTGQIQLLSEMATSPPSVLTPENPVDTVPPAEPEMTQGGRQALDTDTTDTSQLQDTALQDEPVIKTLSSENEQSAPAETAVMNDDTQRTVNSSAETAEAASRSKAAAVTMRQSLKDGLEGPVAAQPDVNAAVGRPGKEAATVQPGIARCLEVGPFDNPTHLTEWLDKKHYNRSTVETFSKDTPVVSDYIVYFPAAQTMAESEDNLSALKNMGVNDVWLFRQGELKGAISLGIFVRKARAELVKNEMIRRGVAAEVTERYEELPRLFVKIYQDSSFQPDYPLTATQCQP